MHLPLSIRNLFTDSYGGVPVARLRSSAETKKLETALRVYGASYQTKISKSKRTGREFVVMLLSTQASHAS